MNFSLNKNRTLNDLLVVGNTFIKNCLLIMYSLRDYYILSVKARTHYKI
jgi:hypothetical protein